jgi:hypothetical protein
MKSKLMEVLLVDRKQTLRLRESLKYNVSSHPVEYVKFYSLHQEVPYNDNLSLLLTSIITWINTLKTVHFKVEITVDFLRCYSIHEKHS